MKSAYKVTNRMKRGCIFTLLSFLLNAGLFGEWTCLADFETYTAGDIFSEASQLGFSASSSTQLDEYEIVADPIMEKNNTLSVNPGQYALSLSTVFVQVPLPFPGIVPMTTSTVSFDYIRLGSTTRSLFIGTTDLPLGFDELTGLQNSPGEYSDYNSLIKIDESGVLKIYDRDGYYDSVNFPVLEMNQWYRFWIVIENAFKGLDGDRLSVGGFTVYVKGQNDSSATVVQFGDDNEDTRALFRRQPLDANGNEKSLIWLMLTITEPALGDGNWLIDNIYYTIGENTLNPDMVWGGYAYSADYDCDSASFLSWVNLTVAPLIWSYSVESWIYMEEPDSDALGAWGYFYK